MYRIEVHKYAHTDTIQLVSKGVGKGFPLEGIREAHTIGFGLLDS